MNTAIATAECAVLIIIIIKTVLGPELPAARRPRAQICLANKEAQTC